MKQMRLFGQTVSEAQISHCGRYRYSLSRDWGGMAKPVVFVMLNPSTADDQADDPTIRRCVGFAKAWCCTRLEVVNLFAFRATSPADMKAAEDPIGPANDRHIKTAVEYAVSSGGLIVCAWGAQGGFCGRSRDVVRLIRQSFGKPLVLGWTANNQPKHPLYLPKHAQPFAMAAPVTAEGDG